MRSVGSTRSSLNRALVNDRDSSHTLERSMKLLLVEDSLRLRQSLETGLRSAGFAVDASSDGRDGLWRAQTNEYDVIVLDWMLPGLDGLALLETLRKS